MRNSNFVAYPWPARMKKRHGEEGAQEEFDMIMQSVGKGDERVVEWVRLEEVEEEEDDDDDDDGGKEGEEAEDEEVGVRNLAQATEREPRPAENLGGESAKWPWEW